MADQHEPNYAADGGFDTRPTWQPPAAIDPRDAAEARMHADRIDRALDARADEPTVRRWLAALAQAVAGGGMTVDDAKGRLVVMGRIFADRYPAGVWTERRVGDIALACKFFPTAHELAQHLDAVVDRMRRERDRARKLAGLPAPGKIRGDNVRLPEPPAAPWVAQVKAGTKTVAQVLAEMQQAKED